MAQLQVFNFDQLLTIMKKIDACSYAILNRYFRLSFLNLRKINFQIKVLCIKGNAHAENVQSMEKKNAICDMNDPRE